MLETTKKVYEATACQDSDGTWVIEVSDLRFARTQANKIEDVEAMAREAIAIVEEVEETDFEINSGL